MENYYISTPLFFAHPLKSAPYCCNSKSVPFRPASIHLYGAAIRIWARSCRPAIAYCGKMAWSPSHLYVFCLALLLIFSGALRSQSLPGKNMDSVITAFAQDKQYAWTGTYHGITRVNKKSKKQVRFTTHNSALPSNYITCIYCRSNGEVWIGTPKGILRYDGYAFIPVNTENSALPDEHITSMQEDANGDLWIGTCKGLVKVHGSKYFVYDHHNSQLSNDRVCLETDERGEINIKLGFQIYLPLKELTWARK
ncbi:MAG TPA: two-component regulator propeller domain-containing protein [Bacteroidia bacterium]